MDISLVVLSGPEPRDAEPRALPHRRLGDDVALYSGTMGRPVDLPKGRELLHMLVGSGALDSPLACGTHLGFRRCWSVREREIPRTFLRSSEAKDQLVPCCWPAVTSIIVQKRAAPLTVASEAAPDWHGLVTTGGMATEI